MSLLQIEINGIDHALRVFQSGERFMHAWIWDAMIEVADIIFNDLLADPDIPQYFKESLKIAENYTESEVIIGGVLEYGLLVERGSETGWKSYRCPYRRYMQGQLRKVDVTKMEDQQFLRKFWEKNRAKYISGLTNGIKQGILNSLNG